MDLTSLVPDTASSEFSAVGAAAANITSSMASGKLYVFVSTTACWIKQGTVASNPVASAGAGSMFVPANTPILLSGGYGARLSVIQASAGGNASITRADRMG